MCVALTHRIQKTLKPEGLKIKDRLRHENNTEDNDNDGQQRSTQKESGVDPITLELPFGFGSNTFHLSYDATFEGGMAVPPAAWNAIRERFVS